MKSLVEASVSAAMWLLAGFALAGAVPAGAQDGYNDPSKVNIAWNRLYNYDEAVKICRDLCDAYPELLKGEVIGKSYEGRDLWAFTLNVEKTGPHDSKPGMYIDGNIHGNEAQATEVVLYSMWYLTKSYGKVPQLTALMDRASFYFLPMINPDGRAHWFDKPNTSSSSRGGKKPTDNDGDGLFDEDGPNDIDGDGQLLSMRRENPAGAWRESPEDPRMLVRVEPLARGDFKRYDRLGEEGLDDDGDGLVNEDGPGGYDTNRNWPADWQPNYIQFGAGDFPASLPETQAIVKFILARPNIAGAQSYHNAGGMILHGPGAGHITYPPDDEQVYEAIGRRGEQMLPYYRYMTIWKDLYVVHGGLVNWTAEDLGIISFTNELWTGSKYFNDPGRAGEKDQLRFNDDLMFGQMFVPWKKVAHPVYGEVEVGGWMKMTGRVPPSFHMEEECHRNFAFTMFHAEQMPLVELRNVTADPIGANLWRVRVDAHNLRLIPTTTAQGARRRYGPRDFIEIVGDGVKVVAGGTIENRFTAPFHFVEHNPHKLWIDEGLGGERYQTFQWLLSAPQAARATIRLSGPRFRDVETVVELSRR